MLETVKAKVYLSIFVWRQEETGKPIGPVQKEYGGQSEFVRAYPQPNECRFCGCPLTDDEMAGQVCNEDRP